MYIGQHKKDKERTTPNQISTCLETENQTEMDKTKTDYNNDKITKRNK